jgi:sugar/nucleoside kinase (ribokinase family)
LAVDVLVVGNLVWEVAARVRRPVAPATDLWTSIRAALPHLERVREDGGGSAANTAIHLARAGRRVVLVGRAGDDPAGRAALQSLARRGIDARVALAPGRATKRNLILVPADGGEPRVQVDVPPRVAPPLPAGAVPADLLAAARVLHLDRASATEAALAAARDGRPVTLDLHTCPFRPAALDRLRAMLPRLDVLMASAAAAVALAGRLRGGAPEPADACAALADLGIHKADLIHYLTGDEIVEASAFVGTLDKKTTDGQPISVDDNALCVMRLKKGGMGVLRASWTNYGQEDNSTRIYGTKGVLRVYDDPRQSLILEKRDGTVERFELDHITTNEEQTSGHRRSTGVIDAFVNSILTNSPSLAEGEEAVKAMRAVFAAARSAEEGRAVRVE